MFHSILNDSKRSSENVNMFFILRHDCNKIVSENNNIFEKDIIGRVLPGYIMIPVSLLFFLTNCYFQIIIIIVNFVNCPG